jgi:opacity protein-like surface antigen
MKKLLIAVTALVSFTGVAHAQDTAPDGSKPYALEPYVGVLGGWHGFDRDSQFGTSGARGKMDGALISGIAGVNIGLGPVFVGAEGNASKGVKDIDWEYGVKGRVGARAGESGLLYVSAGYQWVNGKTDRGYPHRSDWMYGVGVEVGPKDIGFNGIKSEGVRLRLQIDTFDFNSIRPMAGLVFHL